MLSLVVSSGRSFLRDLGLIRAVVFQERLKVYVVHEDRFEDLRVFREEYRLGEG